MDEAWTWQLDGVGPSNGSRRLVLIGAPSLDPAGRALPPEHVRERVREAIDGLEQLLGACGMTFGNVVRVNYHTADAETFFSVYDALTRRMALAGVQPASTFEPPDERSRSGFLVEIEAAALA